MGDGGYLYPGHTTLLPTVVVVVMSQRALGSQLQTRGRGGAPNGPDEVVHVREDVLAAAFLVVELGWSH